jgi:competence protein ComEA
MKKLFLVTLILTLTAFFMQAPVAIIAPTNVVCAQEPEAEPVEAEAPEGEAASVVININTASAEELVALEGIGDKTAQNIVEYRDANGPFAAIEDIKNVKGIGDKKFEKIKENIAIEYKG